MTILYSSLGATGLYSFDPISEKYFERLKVISMIAVFVKLFHDQMWTPLRAREGRY